MNRWIRRTLFGTAAVAGLAAVTAATLVVVGLQRADTRAKRHIELPARPTAVLAIDRDAQRLERGAYLYRSRGCADCHGADGAGRTFVDDGQSLKLAGPNISPGPGSVVAGYGAADWERTLRHGVKRDGTPLRVMPSEDYARLTDADLAALVSHVVALPPAQGGPAVIELPWIARVMYGFGLIPEAAEKIDHRLPPAPPVAETVSVEHGRYVAQMCKGCHGPALEGGRIPGGPPDWPAASRLAPGPDSVIARYPDAQALRTMFATGRSPDGRVLKVMPFDALREINETDVRALHLYLQSGAQP